MTDFIRKYRSTGVTANPFFDRDGFMQSMTRRDDVSMNEEPAPMSDYETMRMQHRSDQIMRKHGGQHGLYHPDGGARPNGYVGPKQMQDMLQSDTESFLREPAPEEQDAYDQAVARMKAGIMQRYKTEIDMPMQYRPEEMR